MLDYNEFYLYLIRHGQSEINVMPNMVGQKEDSQLTEKGREQAKLLGQRLAKENKKLDVVCSSPYSRAHDTCQIALGEMPEDLKSPIAIVPEVREYSAGDWTHAKRDEVHNEAVLLRMAAMTSGFLPPNGESMHMVERRASKWLEDNILYNENIKQMAREKSSGNDKLNIAIFSHGMTIKCLCRYIMNFDYNFIWRIVLENTSITKFYFGEAGWKILSMNDHSHLL